MRMQTKIAKMVMVTVKGGEVVRFLNNSSQSPRRSEEVDILRTIRT